VIPAAWPAENLGPDLGASVDSDEILALARDDDEALSRLIRRWQKRLFSFAYRYLQNEADAADMVAETFAKLHEQRRRLAVGSNLSAWLFTVLANRCRSRLRWEKRHPREAFPAADESGAIPSDQPQPDGALQQQERVSSLQRAIAELPHDLKSTLLLHHYEQLPYREIAAIAGCSERGVETRLYRARQRLREALGDHAPSA
jgi:RNA polymerase sigma-70 factor (ECF subfamily)